MSFKDIGLNKDLLKGIDVLGLKLPHLFKKRSFQHCWSGELMLLDLHKQALAKPQRLACQF